MSTLPDPHSLSSAPANPVSSTSQIYALHPSISLLPLSSPPPNFPPGQTALHSAPHRFRRCKQDCVSSCSKHVHGAAQGSGLRRPVRPGPYHLSTLVLHLPAPSCPAIGHQPPFGSCCSARSLCRCCSLCQTDFSPRHSNPLTNSSPALAALGTCVEHAPGALCLPF